MSVPRMNADFTLTDSELISFGRGSQPMQESDVDAFTEVINNMSG